MMHHVLGTPKSPFPLAAAAAFHSSSRKTIIITSGCGFLVNTSTVSSSTSAISSISTALSFSSLSQNPVGSFIIESGISTTSSSCCTKNKGKWRTFSTTNSITNSSTGSNKCCRKMDHAKKDADHELEFEQVVVLPKRNHLESHRKKHLPGTFPFVSSTFSRSQQYDDDHPMMTPKRWMTTHQLQPTSINPTTATAKCPKTSRNVCQCSSFSSSSSPSSSPTAPPPGMVLVSIDEAFQTTYEALQQIGWDEHDAKLQAEIMVAAELCGNNQGLVKMYQPSLMQPSPSCSKPTIERNLLNSAVVNANQSPGMLAAVTAADLAVHKLQQNSELTISIVTSYNSSTSSGQLAYYVERIANHGYIGIAMCNSPEFVSPAPGAKPVFGTNPLAVGIPQATAPYPFTFDMATSAIALFGVLTAKSKNEPLPPEVAYDKNGNWTTNAKEVLEEGGSIATFGGHKGLGLALCVELLAGGLSGSAVLGQVESKKSAKSWGHTFIVIRPEAIVDDYPSKVQSIIETVKNSGSSTDTIVRIPGERSAKTAVERKKAGFMPIPEPIWASITHTAKHGLLVPSDKV